MKKLGSLYGADLYLDTQDQEVESLANEFLQNLVQVQQEVSDKKISDEVDRMIQRKTQINPGLKFILICIGAVVLLALIKYA
jgi:hypothetical protein